MIFPQVDPSEWIKTYKINVPEADCVRCGAKQNFVIPFAHGKFRGLLASNLECGEEFRQSVFITTDKEFNEACARSFRKASS